MSNNINNPAMLQEPPPQLYAIYPLLGQMRTTQETITYVNEINSSRRIHKRTSLLKLQMMEINSRRRINQRTTLLKSNIMEEYARKTMHPKNLQPLLDDPDKDVDGFMCKYVESL